MTDRNQARNPKRHSRHKAEMYQDKADKERARKTKADARVDLQATGKGR